MSNFHFQADFVANNFWRTVSYQDKDRVSPTYGCFHYPYWRDKTSEFADARFQEAAATALLLANCREYLSSGEYLPTDEQLSEAFTSGLTFLEKIQYEDGSFDEWYKGERGIAATEFTTIAFGLAFLLDHKGIVAKSKPNLLSVIRKSSTWLVGKVDHAKSNHQAAIAAALAITYELLGEEKYLIAANRAFSQLLSRQTVDGWFPEIGGLDVGYCSVLLDYVMVYFLFSGQKTGFDQILNLFDFMDRILPSNGIARNDIGTCLNPYVSGLGLNLLSAVHKPAQTRLNKHLELSNSICSLSPTLSDDLRFSRWSYLPLVTILLEKSEYLLPKVSQTVFDGKNSNQNSRRILYPVSKVLVHKFNDFTVVCFTPNGGRISVSKDDILVFEDSDLCLHTDNGIYSNKGYNEENEIELDGKSIKIEANLGSSQYFFPTFFQRVALRAACLTAVSSKWARIFIDWRRIKNRSAVNQSASSKKTKSEYKVLKQLKFQGNLLTIEYTLKCSKHDISKLDIKTYACDQFHVTHERESRCKQKIILQL